MLNPGDGFLQPGDILLKVRDSPLAVALLTLGLFVCFIREGGPFLGNSGLSVRIPGGLGGGKLRFLLGNGF